jgi:hypothetical protein
MPWEFVGHKTSQSMEPESSMQNMTIPGACCCWTSKGTSSSAMQEAYSRLNPNPKIHPNATVNMA